MFLNPPKPPFNPLPVEDKHFQLFLSPCDNISSSSTANSLSDSCFDRSITGREPARKQVGDYNDQVGKYKSEEMPSSSSCNLEVKEKWMPYKMKLVRQTQQRQNHVQIGTDNVRVCSDCNTTTTPLWRSGPLGPKSLCNACGIRQRKARRTAMEAANNTTVTTTTTESMDRSSSKPAKSSCSKEQKWKTQHFKKPHETAINDESRNSNKRICFGKIALNNNNSDFARVFPRDVEEAAILLMELSCGFIHT